MNNQPAFPGRQKALMIKSEHIGIASEYEIEHNGMTLRDYFAAKAMLGLFSSGHFKGSIFSQNTVEVAKVAYIMADAMLAAREQE
jgi:hypothetical protein